ncbi:MAG: MFS transporter [Ruminococcaceae bacterium]|nr:MFS transporter [Oscillospiraceae bacterium]
MNYNKTIAVSMVGYIVQAVVNNFAPLLFLLFRETWGLSVEQIAFIATFNFAVQLMVDFLSSKFASKIGYRTCIVFAHISAAVGLVGLAVFPTMFSNEYYGLLLAVVFYAIGGGLIEVLVSPIVEACPTEKKEATMSLLHSFYCWGQVGVVALSTLFFATAGIEHWRVMAVLLALIPAVNAVLYCLVPIRTLEDNTKPMPLKQLFGIPVYWLFLLLMMCSGASELTVSQWASALVEDALGVSKTIGDLAGPMSFAVTMGISRVLYARLSETVPLSTMIFTCGILCVISYLMIGLAPVAVVGLIGCALCGFSVGIMWPGTYSLAAKKLPSGGTGMFAYLALAGDAGCSLGPGLAGVVSNAFGDRFQIGILAATIFPLMLVLGILKFVRKKEKKA